MATASVQPRRFAASSSASGPQSVGVLRGDAAGDEVGDEAGDGAATASAAAPLTAMWKLIVPPPARCVTVSSSSFQETMNFSTPSFSSRAVTSS